MRTCSIVGQANLEAVAGQLMGVSCGQNLVSSKLGCNNLCHHILVGEAHDKAVLGSVVLVLVLRHEADAGPVVGLSLCRSHDL